jgi:lipopolysaccharide export system permease protein
MRILRNHILSEFFGVFLTCLFSLIFVLLLGRGLIQMADLIFNKNVSIILVLQMLFYSFPFILTFVIPMAVLLATLLTFGKLSIDNEIMAIRASGVSLIKVITPLLVVTLLFCLFSFLLSDRIASVSHFMYRKLLTQIGMESPQAALEEGTFIKKFKNFVIFIYEIDKNKLKGIRIYQPQEGKPTRTIIAQKGELISIPEKNIIKLKLVHGTSDEPDPKDSSKLYKLNFKTYDLPLNTDGIKEPEELGKKPKDMTVRELKNEIAQLGEAGIKATYPLSAEIHNKIALSFSSLAFLLIGIPLGITTRRHEKSVNFGMSLVLMTLYWLLLIGGKALAQKGLAPPFLSMQFSNFIVGGLGLFLFLKVLKHS